jgi:hypothetical protein
MGVRVAPETGVMNDIGNLAGTLCHYTTAEVAFQHIIPWGQLRMSPYARMRDPLENRELPFSSGEWDYDASAELLPDDVERALADAAAEDAMFAEITEGIRRLRDATRLLSFTIDAAEGYTDRDLPFMRAWARARIWEQYASNHGGVCIAFDHERALSTGVAARGYPSESPSRFITEHEDGAHGGRVEQDRRPQAEPELLDVHDGSHRSRCRTDASVTSGSPQALATDESEHSFSARALASLAAPFDERIA